MSIFVQGLQSKIRHVHERLTYVPRAVYDVGGHTRVDARLGDVARAARAPAHRIRLPDKDSGGSHCGGAQHGTLVGGRCSCCMARRAHGRAYWAGYYRRSTCVDRRARALQGRAQLGDLALFYRAFDQGQGLMRTVLSSLGTLYADALFLEHLFTFLDIEPDTKATAQPPAPVPTTITHGITFERVGFRYPDSEVWVLRAFSLHVPAGATVAVVGANGAGKSTLLKLMCRFYDPQEGRILLDGTDIRTFNPAELRRRIAVMFQYPVHYIATAAENIALGDVHTDLNGEEHAAIRQAAQGAGADAFIQELPSGYDTLLSKQFDGGVELSGGQWQRISLARAFYREAPIVILDEPTSFMDSWAEAAWLDRFHQLTEHRTALIITHRFTTAMRADHIIVMERGAIVEQGTHEALLDEGGRYAQSWRTQTEHRAAPRHEASAFQAPSSFSASMR